jgi:hypothetical protein
MLLLKNIITTYWKNHLRGIGKIIFKHFILEKGVIKLQIMIKKNKQSCSETLSR